MTKKFLLPAGRFGRHISDEEWASLEAAGGITLAMEAREVISRAITNYRDWTAVYEASPRRSSTKPVVAEIAAAARKLATLIDEDDGAPEREAALQVLTERALRQRGEYPFITPIREGVLRLATDAAAELEEWQRDLGPTTTTDPALPPLLLALSAAYRTAGGRGIYTEAALAFAAAAVRLAGGSIQSEEALRQQIKLARAASGEK